LGNSSGYAKHVHSCKLHKSFSGLHSCVCVRVSVCLYTRVCVCVCVCVCLYTRLCVCLNVPSSSTRINCLSFIFSLGSLYFTRQSFSRDMNPFNFTALLCIIHMKTMYTFIMRTMKYCVTTPLWKKHNNYIIISISILLLIVLHNTVPYIQCTNCESVSTYTHNTN
jgi:hypothetical protein